METKFIIGIDLGTTNSAVSYVNIDSHAKEPSERINIFNVPQLTGEGEIGKLSILPSFLYIPGKYDISPEATRIPWNNKTHFVGMFARDHGAKIPDRLVSSAKSWLCNKSVDRHAKILPWGADESVSKRSPVDTTADYLIHIKKAWNSNKSQNEELFLENQTIIITVPASFDEIARDLTLEATKIAGYKNVTLIEEPLAAFYSWLIKNEKSWNSFVKTNELILVCDVGGGTTDFTLISLRDVDGLPKFERIAVGDHLMLGGDNIDLELARYVEKKLGNKSGSLSKDKWKSLSYQCRQAKENILDKGDEKARIILVGEGSSLIGGTLSTEITKDELEDIVLKGFYPAISRDNSDTENIGKTVTEFGLPYEKEQSMTRHLGRFLEKNRDEVKKYLGKEPVPDLILFNGGSLKPSSIQEKIKEGIRSWFSLTDTTIPRVLENPDPDLSVALGATYYGLVKKGIGVKVGSGSARSYYLGFADKNLGEKKSAFCVVERGMDEGSKLDIEDLNFEVIANKPVSFDVYSSSFRSGDKSGHVIDIDNSMTRLAPLNTMIKFGKKANKTSIPVKIEAEYTEMGTLSLGCRSQISDHTWKLQFQLRYADDAISTDIKDEEVYEEAIVDEVKSVIGRCFSKSINKTELAGIVKTFINLTGTLKDKWPLGFIRTVSDELINIIDSRSFSKDHEAKWMNLLGYSLRPGFGEGFDELRIKKLWKIYKNGTLHEKNNMVKSEWWILWRRVAAGLKPGHQRQFFQDLSPVLLPKKTVKTKISPQERLEIWMAIANMERLLVKDKVRLGSKLLSEINPKKSRNQELWALSRIGARELLYGSIDLVIPPSDVCIWIENILSEKWSNPGSVSVALAQMTRKTGDVSRDVTDDIRNKVLSWIRENGNNSEHIKLISEKVAVDVDESQTIFGESLPSGLVLTDSNDK